MKRECTKDTERTGKQQQATMIGRAVEGRDQRCKASYCEYGNADAIQESRKQFDPLIVYDVQVCALSEIFPRTMAVCLCHNNPYFRRAFR